MTFSSRTMRPEDWAEIKHFKSIEFRSPEKMGYEYMKWLDDLRAEANVPMVVTSSYRDPEYNAKVGGAPDSAHCDIPCEATDFGMRPRPDDPNWNFTRFKIVATAIKKGCVRIGSYANGSLHLDRTESRRPAPRMWRVVGGEQPQP